MPSTHQRIALAVVLAVPSLLAQASADFTCNAKSHTVTIEASGGDHFAYRSWRKKKSRSDPPDLVLHSGNLHLEGTGDCRARHWTFRSGEYEYTVTDSAACAETHPPRNAVGRLTVSHKGEAKGDWWCMGDGHPVDAQVDNPIDAVRQPYPPRLQGVWEADDRASEALYGKLRIGKGVISWGGTNAYHPQCKTTYTLRPGMPADSATYPDKPAHAPDAGRYAVFRLEIDTAKCRTTDKTLQFAIDLRVGKTAEVVTYDVNGKASGWHAFSKVDN